MTLNSEDRYLFWFEEAQKPEVIAALKQQLANLDVKAEIVVGVKRPNIIRFGKPAVQAQNLPRLQVKQ